MLSIANTVNLTRLDLLEPRHQANHFPGVFELVGDYDASWHSAVAQLSRLSALAGFHFPDFALSNESLKVLQAPSLSSVAFKEISVGTAGATQAVQPTGALRSVLVKRVELETAKWLSEVCSLTCLGAWSVRNSISYMSTMQVCEHLKSIETLFLGSSNEASILVASLPRLQQLCVGYNSLGCDILRKCLASPRLRAIHMKHVSGIWDCNLQAMTSCPCLEELGLIKCDVVSTEGLYPLLVQGRLKRLTVSACSGLGAEAYDALLQRPFPFGIDIVWKGTSPVYFPEVEHTDLPFYQACTALNNMWAGLPKWMFNPCRIQDMNEEAHAEQYDSDCIRGIPESDDDDIADAGISDVDLSDDIMTPGYGYYSDWGYYTEDYYTE